MAKHKIMVDSYSRRVDEVNAIYDYYAKQGMSNRDIRRRYIYHVLPLPSGYITTTSKKGGCMLKDN